MNHNVRLIGIFLILSYFAKVVLVPIFLALFLAMLLEPLVGRMASRLSRIGAAGLVIVAAGAVCAVLGPLLYAAGLEMVAATPVYMGKINALIASLNRVSGMPDMRLTEPVIEWRHVIYTSLGTMYEAVSILIFVPLLMFYFLVDKENLLESFNVVNGRYFNLPKLNYELPRMLRVFFAANLVTLFFLVLVHGMFALAAGFENWVSLAMLTGFLNLLPIAGAPLSAAGFLFLGIGVKIKLSLALGLIAAVGGIHFLANNIVLPLLVGTRMNMNAVALLAGLLFWSWIWGVAGFLLAVPMTALIKILLECNPETYAFANLMAAKPRRVLSGRRPLLETQATST